MTVGALALLRGRASDARLRAGAVTTDTVGAEARLALSRVRARRAVGAVRLAHALRAEVPRQALVRAAARVLAGAGGARVGRAVLAARLSAACAQAVTDLAGHHAARTERAAARRPRRPELASACAVAGAAWFRRSTAACAGTRCRDRGPRRWACRPRRRRRPSWPRSKPGTRRRTRHRSRRRRRRTRRRNRRPRRTPPPAGRLKSSALATTPPAV